MLVPANNTPWELRKITDWIDASSYIKSITKKWVIQSIENIEVVEDIEKSISHTISKIHQEMLKLRNYDSNHISALKILEWFSIELFPLLSDLNKLKTESRKPEDILKCEEMLHTTIVEISQLLWIPWEYDIESKVNKITDLIDKYSKKQKRATE